MTTYTRWPSPAWIIWVSNREEDRLLDITSSIEVIKCNDYEEYVHEVMQCDLGSPSYQALIDDPNWGNGNEERLVSKIDESSDEWAKQQAKSMTELEEFRIWKENNKDMPGKEIEHVTEKVDTISLEFLEARVAKEDIFKMKLDMFEKDFVRNAERGVKSELRKSDDFFQLASIYFQMKAEASPADNEPS